MLKKARKYLIVVILICLIALVALYVLIQTQSGFAVKTPPPPGIPGPYYISAEARIYGPIADMAAVVSSMGGVYADDFSYVRWGSNPFYRLHVDNTLQEIIYGDMKSILDKFSWNNYGIESNLKSTFNDLKNVNSVDYSSILGQIQYFGNIPGVFIAYYHGQIHPITFTQYIEFNATTTAWLATESHLKNYGSKYSVSDAYQIWGYLTTYVNSTTCTLLSSKDGNNYYYSYDVTALNSTGKRDTTEVNFKITNYAKSDTDKYGNKRYLDYQYAGVTFYLKDLAALNLISGNVKVYEVIDSPGTGYVTKGISPSSAVAGTPIEITARFDPPSAENVNITDLYPNTFTWGSIDVILDKYKVGTGLVASTNIHVTPSPSGSNMTFTIYYTQALEILQSLENDEYIYLTYSLMTPKSAGEYSLPPASMSYNIKTP